MFPLFISLKVQDKLIFLYRLCFNLCDTFYFLRFASLIKQHELFVKMKGMEVKKAWGMWVTHPSGGIHRIVIKHYKDHMHFPTIFGRSRRIQVVDYSNRLLYLHQDFKIRPTNTVLILTTNHEINWEWHEYLQETTIVEFLKVTS